MEKGGHPKWIEKDTYNGCRNNIGRQSPSFIRVCGYGL